MRFGKLLALLVIVYWLACWHLETKGNVYFFALNMQGPDFASVREQRVSITKRILGRLGYLPSI